MEIFLLLLDEVDDAAAILRARLPRLLGLLLAMALFALTVLMVMLWPLLAALAVLGLGVAWLAAPQLRLQFRFKPEP